MLFIPFPTELEHRSLFLAIILLSVILTFAHTIHQALQTLRVRVKSLEKWSPLFHMHVYFPTDNDIRFCSRDFVLALADSESEATGN